MRPSPEQVMERIKQGFQYMLPSICVEIWSKVGDQAAYGKCHNVLAALSVWGHNVRHWFQFGAWVAGLVTGLGGGARGQGGQARRRLT